MVVRSGRKLAWTRTPTSSSFFLPPTPVLQGPLPSFWTRKKGRMSYKLLAPGHSNFQATHGSHFQDNPFPWAQSISFHLCQTLNLHKHLTPSTHPQETQTPPLLSGPLTAVCSSYLLDEWICKLFSLLWTLLCSLGQVENVWARIQDPAGMDSIPLPSFSS